MFGIGFFELLIIGLVALVVLGPEKLPRAARTAGHLAGRLQRYVAEVKADICREIELEELRKLRESMEQAASGLQDSVESELSSASAELDGSLRSKSSEDAVPAHHQHDRRQHEPQE
jgi:sec-independent protein translocase protein TatB